MSETEVVYCSIRGVYEALEYGRAYQKLSEIGPHTRIKLPDGRVRKYPSDTLSPIPPPQLGRWKLDDPIADPLCDFIDVSFELDGAVRWLALTTPAYLAHRLVESVKPCWAQVNLLIVPEITESVVAASLQHLLEQGELHAHSLSLDVEVDAWFVHIGGA